MATVINHEPLFSTDLKYFKALQIIGGKTIFDRYKLASNMLDNFDERYRYFLSYPVKEGDRVEFHGIKAKNNTKKPGESGFYLFYYQIRIYNLLLRIEIW